MTNYICNHPGCGAVLKKRGKCKKHQEKTKLKVFTQNPQRLSASQRGYGSKWRAARLSFLKNHPLCKICEGRGKVTLATEVDHIIPHKMNLKLFWSRSNWQPLCKSCHSKKTSSERY